MGAIPTATRALATWTDPRHDDNAVGTMGFCLDHLLVDATDREPQVPGAPPSYNGWFWDHTANNYFLAIPELRGAILAPKVQTVDADDLLQPCDNLGTADTWHTTLVPKPWHLTTHAVTGTKVAHYAPADLAASLAAHEQYLITLSAAPKNRAHYLNYLLAPPDPDGDGQPEPYGYWIHFGIVAGQAQYSLRIPGAPSPTDPYSYWEILYRWEDVGGTWTALPVASRNGGSHAKRVGDVEGYNDHLWIIPTVTGLCLWRPDDGWVYTRADWGGVRAGDVMIEVYGCRAWFAYGWCLFPQTATIRSAVQSYDVAYTTVDLAAPSTLTVRGTVVPMGHATQDYNAPGTDLSFVLGGEPNTLTGQPSGIDVVAETATATTGRLVATFTNHSPVDTLGGVSGCRTPGGVLYGLAECHDTYYPYAGRPLETSVDLEPFLESVELTEEASGHGDRCTIVLRDLNVTAGTGGQPDTYEPGWVSQRLLGQGRVTLALQHIFAEAVGGSHSPASDVGDDTLVAFDGVVDEIRIDQAGVIGKIAITAQDVSLLWAGDQATKASFPQPAGWDFRSYTTRLVSQAFVPHSAARPRIHYPADVTDSTGASPVWIPDQHGGATISFDPSAGLVDILDRICEVCEMTWYVRAGHVYFDHAYDWMTQEPVFTLDSETITGRDLVIVPFTYRRSYRDSLTHAFCRGRDLSGWEVGAMAKDATALTDPDDPFFVGRWRQATRFEPDNAEPQKTATRMLRDAQWSVGELTWSTIWRDLHPGDVVETQITTERVPLPLGTRFRITAATTSLALVPEAGDDPVALSTYTAQLVQLGSG